jgi:hypothetical protein
MLEQEKLHRRQQPLYASITGESFERTPCGKLLPRQVDVLFTAISPFTNQFGFRTALDDKPLAA